MNTPCPAGGVCLHPCPLDTCFRATVEQFKPHMVWSRRLDRYVRTFLTDSEWARYDRRGSID